MTTYRKPYRNVKSLYELGVSTPDGLVSKKYMHTYMYLTIAPLKCCTYHET